MAREREEKAHQYFVDAYKSMQENRFSEAYKEVKVGLELDPSSYYGHYYLGYIAAKLGHRQEVADQYLYLLQGYGYLEEDNNCHVFTPRPDVLDDPDVLAKVLYFLENIALALFAIALQKKSKVLYRQSLSYFDSVLKYDPEYPWLDVIRAWCLIEIGDDSKAETILRKWLRFQPEMPRVYFVIARLCMRKGDWLQAIRYVVTGYRMRLKYSEKDESAYQKRHIVE